MASAKFKDICPVQRSGSLITCVCRESERESERERGEWGGNKYFCFKEINNFVLRIYVQSRGLGP